MPAQPNEETAARLQQMIKDATYFLFLATGNSMASRWCPWEIGYADGVKPRTSILIVPTREGGTTHGNEYLALYQRVDLDSLGNPVVFRPGGAYPRNLS